MAAYDENGKAIGDFLFRDECAKATGIYYDINQSIKSNKVIDPDGGPGYDGAQIVEVLSEIVDGCYLGYLEAMEIPYIFAGEDKIDVELALFKLRNFLGINILLLEGGSILKGSFQREDVIDELSLVVAPIVADKNDKPLFTDSTTDSFHLTKSEIKDEVIVLNYKRKK